jgi:hypothetical protein
MTLAVATIINAELSIPWTMRDFDQWLDRIPARERAEVVWARPAFESALDTLLTQSLDNVDDVDNAVRKFVYASCQFRRVFLRMLSEALPLAVLYEGILAQIPDVLRMIDFPVVKELAETAIRTVVQISIRYGELLQAQDESTRSEFTSNFMTADLDELAAAALVGENASYIRAQAFVAALVEGSRRNVSQGRIHELSRFALRYSLRALGVARREGIIASDEQVYYLGKLQTEDDLLAAATALAIAGKENLATELTASEYYPEWMYERALNPQPEPQPQVRRVFGRITGVTLRGPLTIGIEGHDVWLPATAEQVERALSMREQFVAATFLTGTHSRLLRLDPTDALDQSDAATRTRDMLHDWDELLERLAR